MENYTGKEKTMILKKTILVSIGCICTVLFVGVINNGSEYYNPELCLKFPTLKMVFVRPDLPDHYKIEELSQESKKNILQYNKNYELNKKIGFWGKVLSVAILQFLLSSIFIKIFEKYNRINLQFDIILFLISLSLLLINIIFYTYFLKKLFICIGITLVINFLVNYKLRNLIFKKIEKRLY
jgi:hypothetical protein